MEQQLGEKPPRASTCPLEENPGQAEPPNQRPPGLGRNEVDKNVNFNFMENSFEDHYVKGYLYVHPNKDTLFLEKLIHLTLVV